MTTHGEHHHPEPESYAALRTKALESLPIEKGLMSSDAIDESVVRPVQFAGELEIIRRIGKHDIDRCRGQLRHFLHAVPDDDPIARKRIKLSHS